MNALPILSLMLLSLAMTTPPAFAGGIAMSFGEIRADNLAAGRVYKGSRDIMHAPYYVKNRTSGDLDFVVEASVPGQERLVEGYETIPDVSWITVETPFLSAGPDGMAETDIYISVPDDPAYRGRRYQVQIGARTVGKGFVQMALSGRLLFSVFRDTVPWTAEEQGLRQAGLRFRSDPYFLKAEGVKTGRKIKLSALAGKPLYVRNDSQYEAVCRVQPVLLKEGYVGPPAGYTAYPDVSILKLKGRAARVPPHAQKEIEGSIMIPKEYRGRSFYLAIEISDASGRSTVKKYQYLFIRTEP